MMAPPAAGEGEAGHGHGRDHGNGHDRDHGSYGYCGKPNCEHKHKPTANGGAAQEEGRSGSEEPPDLVGTDADDSDNSSQNEVRHVRQQAPKIIRGSPRPPRVCIRK